VSVESKIMCILLEFCSIYCTLSFFNSYNIDRGADYFEILVAIFQNAQRDFAKACSSACIGMCHVFKHGISAVELLGRWAYGETELCKEDSADGWIAG
jgi:hypothetical protein